MIYLWKGYHSRELPRLIEQSWLANNLLILCSPLVHDFSFVEALPKSEIKTIGFTTAALPIPQGKWEHADKPVLGIFTTGTVSGAPRLVLYSKNNILNSLQSLFSLFDETRIETVFCYPQPFHTFGLVLGYLYAMLRKKQLVCFEGVYTSEAHLARLNVQTQSLLTLGTPAHFFDLIQFVEKNSISVRPSYTAILGGAKVTSDLWNAVHTRLKIERPSIGYGASEASPGVTHLPPGLVPKEAGEIGFVLPGVSIELLGHNGFKFQGENLCIGIIEGKKLTYPKSVILSDLIEKRDDGRLVYVGRTSQIINRGGEKWSIEALELLIQEKLGFHCACFGVEDERLGEDLGIVLEFSDSEGVTEAEIQNIRITCRAILREQFGREFSLTHFSHCKRLPLNENGKLDRHKLSQS